MMLAENEETTAGDKAQTATGTQDPASEPGPETDNKEQSTTIENNTLEAF